MANDATKVGIGKPAVANALWTAPAGTTLPTTTSDNLATMGYTAIGYGGDAGVTVGRSKTTEKIKAWGGDVVRVSSSEYEETYKVELLQHLSPEVLKEVYGQGNVSVATTTGKIDIYSKSEDLPNRVWIIDLIPAENTLERIVIPLGQITEFDDLPINDTDPMKYGVTVTSYPYTDSTGTTPVTFNSHGIIETTTTAKNDKPAVETAKAGK